MTRDLKGLSADTRRLLAGTEGREVDFKSQASGVKPEDIVAFANATGGVILIGVDETRGEGGVQQGVISGSNISDETRRTLVQQASSCRPTVSGGAKLYL